MATKNEKEAIVGTEGAYVRSPNGKLWRVKVDDNGVTSSEEVK